MLGKIWKDPVWSKVIATGILAVFGLLGAYLLGVWPAIGRLASSALSFLLAPSSIPNWGIALLCLGVIPTIFGLVLFSWRMLKEKKDHAPNWMSYTYDDFFGLRWRWRYVDGNISGLCTFCPKCDFQVYARDSSNFRIIDRILYFCDSCGSNLAEIEESQYQLESKVKRFIQQRIRNGSWIEKL